MCDNIYVKPSQWKIKALSPPPPFFPPSGGAVRLAGSYFPDQGLNLGHGSPNHWTAGEFALPFLSLKMPTYTNSPVREKLC